MTVSSAFRHSTKQVYVFFYAFFDCEPENIGSIHGPDSFCLSGNHSAHPPVSHYFLTIAIIFYSEYLLMNLLVRNRTVKDRAVGFREYRMVVSPAVNGQHQINLPVRYCIVVHILISIFIIHCFCLFLYHHGQEPQMEYGTSFHLPCQVCQFRSKTHAGCQ